MSEELVILVDNQDNPTGVMNKLEAHEKGVLHRAFSVFILNDRGEMLIHQRALTKYHSAGLWTNACCSHPRPDESIPDAAKRRLREEMGMECVLKQLFHFTYLAKFDNGLTEYELDHVLAGYSNVNPVPQPDEVMDFRWVPMDELLFDLNESPEKYTVWFRMAMPRVLEYLETSIEKN